MNDNLCFVIMPFQDDMREVYWSAIKPACEAAGYHSLRVDELEGVFNINKKIIQNIFLSEAIIADLTHWRPNVFYEMGVAHAIGNKTIMIIEQDHKLPFDVSDYRCIQYRQTPEGMTALVAKLVGALKSLEQWRQEPSNPVQDFMPPEAALPLPKLNALQRELDKAQHQLKSVVPKAQFEAVQRELQEREARLRDSVPKIEAQRLQKTLQEKEAVLANSVAKAEWQASQKRAEDLVQRNETLRRENEELRNRKAAAPAQGYAKGRVQLLMAAFMTAIIVLGTQVFKTSEPSSANPSSEQRADPPQTKAEKSEPTLSLRRRPWLRATPTTLSGDEVKNMLAAKGFYDSYRNESGAGIQNDFALHVIGRDSLVLDHETGLVWQQSGSQNTMTYAAAEQFVRDVNRKGFGGFANWRLPTLEEAMSLMEREKKNGDLYIDPIFDRSQWWIWTSDKSSGSSCWVAYFRYGYCYDPPVGHSNYVRLVR